MNKAWLHDGQLSCPGGVSSAADPDEIDLAQLAWAKNVSLRSGKPHTRPAFVERLILPVGIVQGADYFSIQNGMLIIAIAGHIHRVRMAGDEFSSDEITPPSGPNSAFAPEVWMQETSRSFVIQDGQSDAIIYDGNLARRAIREWSEVPRGRQMAYGNGRLCVAIEGNKLIVGDIQGDDWQSELKFTESTYLLGGGSFFFPRDIKALKFQPRNDTTTGFGSLTIFGDDFTKSARVEVPRDLWQATDGFITDILTDVGAIGQGAVVSVNQDLYFRSGDGDIRSLRYSRIEQQSPGNAPLSREISRIVENETVRRLVTSTGIYFDNRLLMTAAPFINAYNNTSFAKLVSLDLASLSSMRAKAPPAYDGEWTGLEFSRVVRGKFRGVKRAFVIATGAAGENRLWEIVSSEIADKPVFSSAFVASPIKSSIEYRRFNFETKGFRKRLERADVYISKVDGPVTLAIYWRADAAQKWTKWDEASVCAKTTDASTAVPHVFKNLALQHRPQIRSFTIPDSVNDVTAFAASIGFDFQIKLEWTGKLQVDRLVVHASRLEGSEFASRDEVPSDCIYEDVTSEETDYSIPVAT